MTWPPFEDPYREYLRENRNKLLLNIMVGRQKRMFDFITGISWNEAVRRYYTPHAHPYLEKFIENAKKGSKEYNNDLTEDSYIKFWGATDNIKHMYAIDRKAPPSILDHKKVLEFMKKNKSDTKHSQILRNDTNIATGRMDIDDAISKLHTIGIDFQYVRWALIPILSSVLNAICKPLRYVFDIPHINIFRKYRILYPGIDGKYGNKYYVYVVTNHSGPAETIPLEQGISVVKATTNPQLVHELTHSVQHCFNSLQEFPKELAEIPAMMVENLFYPVDQKYKDKHISLAIADLLSDNPDDFDKIFNETSNSTPHARVSNRFYPYITYPKQYYGYVLGLLMKSKDNKDLVDMICSKGTLVNRIKETIGMEK